MRKALPLNPTAWTCLFEGGYPFATCVGWCEDRRAERSIATAPPEQFSQNETRT